MIHPFASFDETSCAFTGLDADGDPRPQPPAEALEQLGRVMLTEVLDLLLGSALEDQVGLLCETLIGGLHAGVQRLEREADRARDQLGAQLREFDGSEVADLELQDARRRAAADDLAVLAWEQVRDAAAAAYASQTGETWSPWRGPVRRRGATAAQVEARVALAAIRRRREADAPSGPVVAFRGAPAARSVEDARRVFDALNWAHSQWPDMVLAVTDAPGPERLAKSWARQKGVDLILARPDFDRHGRAAPFRANDDLIALEPVCCLTLARSLDPERAGAGQPFGPAMNLSETAARAAVRCVRIAARRPPG